MGYFVYAHIVEGDADARGVRLTTTVFVPRDETKKALFSWKEGERAPGLFPFASGTLYCDSVLSMLPGYPITERHGDRPGENEELIQVQSDFRPSASEAVLFHFLLPSRFVPRPDLKPLVTPSFPSLIVRGERLSVTFVAKGGADVRFWMKRLEPKESLSDFELDRLFEKPPERSTKASFEISLGIVKFRLGEK